MSTIGIVGPSSVIPTSDLAAGVQRLEGAGFDVKVHPVCRKKWMFFSGTHSERANAFYEYARSPEIDILWCARGGYGAYHLLPLLEKLTRSHGVPKKKLLVGYSDTTALFDFVRSRWGWSVLHGPLPARPEFQEVKGRDWVNLQAWVNGKSSVPSWESKALKFLTSKPRQSISGEVTGGNLAVWTALTGTPFRMKSGRPQILFLEDITESPSRIDRMVCWLDLANAFDGVRAIILGDFYKCEDVVPMEGSKPLRPKVSQLKAFHEIFGRLGEKRKIPVAYGLPVGHGPGRAALPIGAKLELSPQGRLRLVDWDWLG